MTDRFALVTEALSRAGLLRNVQGERALVEHVTADSRDVRQGSLFLAVPGSQADGHAFVPDAVRRGAQLLQKLFRIRPCEDTFFANRSRPYLQHQIGRCSAPCVGLVTRDAYAQDLDDAAKVLEGRNTELIVDLGRRMESAAERLQFEAAARFRDQIAMLKQIQASQSVTRIAGRDIDAVAIAGGGPEFCVSVVFVRGGRNLGSTNFFPRGWPGGEGEALAAFLSQYYLTREPPDEILVSRSVEDDDLLEAALCERAGRKVPIRSGVRGTRARWLPSSYFHT